MRRIEGGEHVPVLMMTGLDDSDSINRVYEVGATDFITKPIAWPMLGHRVRYVLRANRAFLDLTQSQARLTNAQRIAQLGHWEWHMATEQVQRSEEDVPHSRADAATAALPRTRLSSTVVHADDRGMVEDAIYAALHRHSPSAGFPHRASGRRRSHRA